MFAALTIVSDVYATYFFLRDVRSRCRKWNQSEFLTRQYAKVTTKLRMNGRKKARERTEIDFGTALGLRTALYLEHGSEAHVYMGDAKLVNRKRTKLISF